MRYILFICFILILAWFFSSPFLLKNADDHRPKAAIYDSCFEIIKTFLGIIVTGSKNVSCRGIGYSLHQEIQAVFSKSKMKQVRELNRVIMKRNGMFFRLEAVLYYGVILLSNHIVISCHHLVFPRRSQSRS